MKKITLLLMITTFVTNSLHAQTYFSEGFELGVPPAGWTDEAGSGADEGNLWVSSSINFNEGAASAWFEDYNGNNDRWLISPDIDLSSSVTPIFTYYEAILNGSFGDTHEVYYSTNYSGSGAAATAKWELLNGTLGVDGFWAKIGPYELPASANVYIAFRYVGNFADDWFIDTILIEESPACPEVSQLFADSITDVSADMSWNAISAATGYNWEVQPDGVAQGTAAAPASGSTATTEFSTGNVLQPETPYDIYIQTDCSGDGTSDYFGPISFTTTATPPSNDLLENAIAVVCDGNYTGDTTNANFTETDAPDGFGASNDTRNIWYSYTGSGTQEDVTVDLCASGYDTAFIVYTGTSGNLVAVGGNDDNAAVCGSGFRSYGSFLSDGSTTYYINVNGYSGTTGLVDMTISCASTTPPPSNDEVGDAVALTLDASVQGTTEGATQDGSQDQPACDPFGSIADVWYTVTLAEEGDLQIVTTISGNSDQANVTVYTSDSGLEEDEVIAFCSDAGAGETVSGNLVAGTYYIRVWSDGVASTRTEGTFDIVANFTGLSINDFDNPKLFQYYPNPVKNVLTLNGQRNIESIYIYNMLGQEVMYSQPQALDSQLDMSKLQSGTYFMQVTVGTTIQTVRVIKQ